MDTRFKYADAAYVRRKPSARIQVDTSTVILLKTIITTASLHRTVANGFSSERRTNAVHAVRTSCQGQEPFVRLLAVFGCSRLLVYRVIYLPHDYISEQLSLANDKNKDPCLFGSTNQEKQKKKQTHTSWRIANIHKDSAICVQASGETSTGGCPARRQSPLVNTYIYILKS